jgi:hypothetical protein
MGHLAATFSILGRHEEAVAMKERALEFRHHVLPEDHPHIGEGHVRIVVACGVIIVGRRPLSYFSCTGEAMENVAWAYFDLGRYKEALVMNKRALELYVRVLPEDHPWIGEGHVLSGVACGVVLV